MEIVATETQRALFDYGALDQETQIAIRLRTSEIKSLAKRMAADVVEIGGKLAEVKDYLGGNGRFQSWLSAELGWSERTAYNFIAVWQKFSAADFRLENIATSALYLLAAPSTPAEAVESAKQIANEGGEVTNAVAKALVGEAKEARRTKAPGFFEDADAGEEDDPEDSVDEEEPVLDDEATAAAEEESPSSARPAEPKQPPAKTAAAAQAKAKVGSSEKEIEAAWRKYGVSITIQLLPAKHAERQAMVTIRAGDFEPLSKVRKESEVIFVGAALELIEQYKRDLPAKMAKAKPAPKAPAKPAAKPTKPAPKSGVKQSPKGVKQKAAKAGK